MNPITRMMKRYIKTPLKYALPLLFIGALVLVSISGCTSSTNPTSSATPSSGDMISSLNSYFSSTKNETIVNPFTQTTVDNHTAYIGSFKDGSDKLTPKIHNYTVIVANNNTDAKKLFALQVNKTKSTGYVENPPTIDTQWRGWYESTTSDANGLVYITVCEPHSCYISLSNEFALRDPSTFVVTVDKINNA
jgi:hypothetical protein